MCRNDIFMVDIPQFVKVRKYEVDKDSLRTLLRENKAKAKVSNKTIAEALGVPVTMVEHWFRTDSCFSIPEPELWMNLKELLGIEDHAFDDQIMTFEYKVGTYEKSERHYFSYGISPTLTCDCGNEKIIVGVCDES